MRHHLLPSLETLLISHTAVMFSSEKKEASIGAKSVQEGPYHSSSPSSISHEDVEGSPVPGTTVQLKRRLQSRHLQMIAIGKEPVFLPCYETHF